jgi:hypothetical protein
MATPVLHLDRDERRARARGNGAPVATAAATRCLYCYGLLTNGSAVCGEECDSGWWAIVPTRDGELYEPPLRPPRGAQQARPGRRG